MNYRTKIAAPSCLIPLLGAALVLVCAVSAQAADKMYWTDYVAGKIQRANLDGADVEELLTGLHMPFGIALDLVNEKMYFAENDVGAAVTQISRANLDGTGVEVLITGYRAFGVALDTAGGKIYWAGNGNIYRANMADGSDAEMLVSSTGPYGIAIDLDNLKMYWTDTDPNTVRRANLDGTEAEQLSTGINRDTAVALDLDLEKMYWGDFIFAEGGCLRRANLDGTGAEVILGGFDSVPTGIALDLANEQVYYTFTGSPGSIHRANLDGSDAELLVDSLSFPWAIALQIAEPETPVPLAWWPAGLVMLLLAAAAVSLRRYRKA